MERIDVIAAFYPTVDQASADQNRDLGAAPGNSVYGRNARGRARGYGFEPLFEGPDAASLVSCSRPSKARLPSRSNASLFPAPPRAGTASSRMRSRSTVPADVSGHMDPPVAASRISCGRTSSASGAAAPVVWTPGLSDTHRKAMALDCGMRRGKTSIAVRGALLLNTLKRLGLDTDTLHREPGGATGRVPVGTRWRRLT